MAGHIPRDFIEQLLSRTDIIDIIQERVQVKKAGKNFVACCPFHQEKTPSFNISPSKQFYHCFGCGVSGNVVSFLLDFDHMEFVDAIEFLARRVGLEVPYEKGHAPSAPVKKQDDYDLLDNIARFYQQQLKQDPAAIDYLKSRGLTGTTAKQFGLGFAPDRWDSLLKAFPMPEKLLALGMLIEKDDKKGYYDRFRHRIMFPIRNTRGQLIGFGGRVLDQSLPKYLNSPETALFSKNQELYGWHEALQATRKLSHVFVVEGYLDVLALHQAGITETVATLGTATSSAHIQKIARQCPHIIFCFDGDRAGREAAWRALQNALPVLQDGMQLDFLFLPEGEDPDSYVQKQGADAFYKIALQALPFSEYFFKQLSQDCPLQFAEGRTKLVTLAIPLLAKIPEGAFLQSLCDQLMRLSKFDAASLQKLLREAGQTQVSASITDNVYTHQQHHRLQLTPIRLTIALLLQYPQLAKHAAAHKLTTLSQDIPGIGLLQSLLQLCQRHEDFSTAMLLERWREDAAFQSLSKLAAHELEISNTHTLEQLWQDCVKHLIEQTQETRVQQLLEKAKNNTLTEEERQTLLALTSLRG